MSGDPVGAYVLVVEDDADVREAMSDVLVEAGYRVACAVDGREALGYLRRRAHLPSVVLLDLMMPVLDGWQFRAEQERDPRLNSVPVVVMSAVTAARAAVESLHAADFVPKPVELNVLLDVVRRFCGPPASREVADPGSSPRYA